MEAFLRNTRLIGEENQKKLFCASVAVFGLGGVGSYVVEALVRAGVGKMLLVDGDCVEMSNLNRQLFATYTTLGRPKAEVAKERALSINPHAVIDARHAYYDEETSVSFDFAGYDYICDCIDSVRSKLLLVESAQKADVPIISCMGAGNKLDPTSFCIAPIEQTSVCPLARVMRRACKERGLSMLCVYSNELAKPTLDGSSSPGSISFVPSAAGLVMAGRVIRDLIGM